MFLKLKPSLSDVAEAEPFRLLGMADGQGVQDLKVILLCRGKASRETNVRSTVLLSSVPEAFDHSHHARPIDAGVCPKVELTVKLDPLGWIIDIGGIVHRRDDSLELL